MSFYSMFARKSMSVVVFECMNWLVGRQAFPLMSTWRVCVCVCHPEVNIQICFVRWRAVSNSSGMASLVTLPPLPWLSIKSADDHWTETVRWIVGNTHVLSLSDTHMICSYITVPISIRFVFGLKAIVGSFTMTKHDRMYNDTVH